MCRLIFIMLFTCLSFQGYSQVTLNADGNGNTYDLITSVLAPGYNPIEVPDCNHEDFGDHIDEIFDEDLGKYVFRFHIHVTPDNDRCINEDRQRNEIKSYNQSPDNLLGIQGELVEYKWRFKLDEDFQSSPNFTHIHQLKSVGGPNAGLPMYTITTRKSNPDRLEIRHSSTDAQSTLTRTDLAPMLGLWLEVKETILYGVEGQYEIEIKSVNDGEVLFYYANEDIINWQEGADFVRPKWGIYRSLDNAQDLRDEIVYYSDFSIKEINETSLNHVEDDEEILFNNIINDQITIKKIPLDVNTISIYTAAGQIVKKIHSHNKKELSLDVSNLRTGKYILNFKGSRFNRSFPIFKK